MEKKRNKMIYASSDCSDMLYACGMPNSDPYLYVESEGRGYVIVGDRDYALAKTQVKKGVTVLHFSDIRENVAEDDLMSDNFYEKVSLYFNTDKWIVPRDFPLWLANKLQSYGFPVLAKEGLFYPQRMVKAPDEIAEIRKAETVTQEMMMMVRDIIKCSKINGKGILERKDGLIITSEYMHSEIDAEFKRRQYTSRETIVACGTQGAYPHCVGNGPIYANLPIVCDIFPKSDVSGYWGDMTRTFCKGAAAPIVKKAFDAVKKASDAVLANLKAGVIGADMHNLAKSILTDAGFPTGKNNDGVPVGFFHGLGHGVGLDIHEEPSLSTSYSKPIPENSLVTVEPGLYDPAWGGIRLEDLVLVTKNGIENLCSMEKELEIL